VRLPDPIVEIHDGILVVRDDMLPGGTKLRYLLSLFDAHDEVVYASPVFGGAQLALAQAAKMTGKQATLFVAKRKVMHPRTASAAAVGARIIEVPHGYLSNVQSRAKMYCQVSGAHYLPFGGDGEAAVDAIAQAARTVWNDVGPFDEVWSAMGSGVLQRGLQRGMPQVKRFYGIMVGGETKNPGIATAIPAGMPFEKAFKPKPPFPSDPFYDAKAWAACVRASGESALFWNVLGPPPGL